MIIALTIVGAGMALVLAGMCIGHEMAQSSCRKRIDAALTVWFKAESMRLREIIDLRKQLSKFHTTRDKSGRFVKKKIPSTR